MPSGGLEPRQPSPTHTITKSQKDCLNSGRLRAERTKEVSSHGKNTRISIEAPSAITPMSLRRIMHRKHDAGCDLCPEHECEDRAETPPAVQVTRCRVGDELGVKEADDR